MRDKTKETETTAAPPAPTEVSELYHPPGPSPTWDVHKYERLRRRHEKERKWRLQYADLAVCLAAAGVRDDLRDDYLLHVGQCGQCGAVCVPCVYIDDTDSICVGLHRGLCEDCNTTVTMGSVTWPEEIPAIEKELEKQAETL